MQIGIVIALIVMVACVVVQFLGAIAKHCFTQKFL